MNLSPYGPGKFSHKIDSVAYEVSLCGADDEAGTVEYGGSHHCLLRGWDVDGPCGDVCATARLEQKLTDDDMEYMRKHSAGLIVSENSDGFVSVQWFETETDLAGTWGDICNEAEEDEAEADDDGTYVFSDEEERAEERRQMGIQ